MTPEVSIIIPCYNQAIYLPEALESLINQTFYNWEAIVVNDASPDNTAETALNYCRIDPRIKLVTPHRNLGLSGARNFGIAASVGPYILPLDADDKLDPNYLEKSVKVLEEHKSVKVVYTDITHFGSRNDVVKRPEFTLRDLCFQNIFQPCAMFRRRDFENTEGYRTNMKYGYEDWDFWFQIIFENAQVCHINEPLFYGRIKEKSMITDLIGHSEKEQLMRTTIIRNNFAQFKKWAPGLAQQIHTKHSLKNLYRRIESKLNKNWLFI